MRQSAALYAEPAPPSVLALLQQMSQENEGAFFATDAKHEAVLRGEVVGYYADLPSDTTVLDTSRARCAKVPLLARLYSRHSRQAAALASYE